MPFKRKIKNENTKEKKAIATRLLVISLKMDDYIYKNKPISVQEAQLYTEEIDAFKLQCIDDVRALQVIEKLTLFMKSIIKKNTLSNICNENSNIEIDNKQRSDSVLPLNIITHREDNNEMKTNPVESNNDQGISLIDEQNNIDMDSFLNSSKDPLKETFCKDVNDQTVAYTVDVREHQFQTSLQIQKDVTPVDVMEPNITLNNLEIASGSNYTVLQYTTTDNNTQVMKETIDHCDKTDDNNVPNNSVTLSNNIIGPLVNDNNDENILIVKNLQDKIEVTTTRKKNTKNKTAPAKKEVKLKFLNKDKNSQSKQKVPKKSSEKVTMKKRKNDTRQSVGKPSKFCNRVDNGKIDVSWVKDIKYIREVCKVEYDLTPNNLGNTFWNDLTLPANWNFNDFHYTD